MTLEVISCVLFPLNPLVGDKAEAHVVLKLPPDTALPPSAVRALPVTKTEALPSPIPFAIQDAYIEGASKSACGGGTLAFTVCFTPWQTGTLNLPPFKCSLTPDKECQIIVPPVTIMSVFPDGVAGNELRPPLPPLLPPVTAHVLYASIAVFLLLIAAMCFAAARWKEICKYFILKKMLRQERRNAKFLQKRLAALAKSRTDDRAFCTGLCQAVRSYLAARFGEDLAACTTGEVAAVCAERTAHIVSDKAEEAYNALIAVMQRTDIVRFCPKDGAQGVLQIREREYLINEVLQASSGCAASG